MRHIWNRPNQLSLFNRSGAIVFMVMALGAVVAVGGVMGIALGSPEGEEPEGDEAPALSVEGLPLTEDYPYDSPLAAAMNPDGDVVYVVHHTGRRVEAVERASGEALWSTALEQAPSGIALAADGNRLYVTSGLDEGRIEALDADSGDIEFTLSAGHTPVAPVASSGGGTLYVSNRFDNEVAAYDLESRELRGHVQTVREPIAAALTPDDGMLVVAHHLPAQPANSNRVAAKVDLIDTEPFEIAASLTLPNGSTSVRDVCVSPDGAFAYVTHNVARFHLPTTQLERGWMNTSALSVIDLENREWLTTVLLDDVDLGAANPWGVACSADGQSVLVAHSGTHELSRIDRQALHEKIDRVAAGEQVSEVSRSLETIPNDLAFLVDLRERIRLPGNGARGLAVGGTTVAVTEYFSDSLAFVDLSADANPSVEQILLGEQAELSEVREGEKAFFDADLCFQKWQSCASCHPDARADALNWDLLNDGIGNPKNTRSMLFTHETPPVMITGVRDQAETAVRAGFQFIQFVEVPEETAAAVDAYLRALQPVPSPRLADGELSPAAQRGKEIFEQANCAECHSGEYFTDGRMHDVGVGPDELGIQEFVTPLLNEVWRTGPYLYDGRAETMMEVLTEFNPDDRHGATSELTSGELEDLTEYILSL